MVTESKYFVPSGALIQVSSRLTSGKILFSVGGRWRPMTGFCLQFYVLLGRNSSNQGWLHSGAAQHLVRVFKTMTYRLGLRKTE